MSKKLLEAYVASILAEFMDNSMLIGDPSKAADIFIAPFRNLAGITAAEFGKGISTAKLAAKLAYNAVKGAFGAKTEFDKIFAAHDQETKSIQSKFQKYYDDVASLTKNTDLNMVAFMWNPGLYTVARASLRPSVGASLSSAGSTAIKGAQRAAGKVSAKLGGDYYYESLMREADEEQPAISGEELKRLEPDVKHFREVITNRTKGTVERLKEAMAMGPDEFMEKYGKDESSRKADYDALKEKLSDIASKRGVQLSDDTNNSVDAIAKSIEENIGQIVQIAKQGMLSSYINEMETQTKELEDDLKREGVDPQEHGLVPLLHDALEQMKKIKVPEQAA